MPGVIASFTESLAVRAVALAPGSAGAAGDLRSAAGALEALAATAATTEDQWRAALADWRGKLTTLTQLAHPGGGSLQLILDTVGYRLPPLPGLDAILAPIPVNLPLDRLDRYRDDLASGASIGPIALRALIPSVAALRPGAAAGDVLGFLPPNGFGIDLDAGVAHGGGTLSFSDQPHWRLAGAFGVQMGVVSVSALGILERPGGALSLVLLLGARFTPGLQLSFGFQISGVGGLIGVNRRADTDALRARLASGAATDVLFPDDPIANAPALLETLGAIFVPAPGSFVVGPTFELTWLKLGELDFLRVDVGVFIELPGPARIVIVGRAIAEVPAPGTPLLHLQLDVVGEIDFAKSLAQIRAALVNSRALGIFRAAGDAVLVMCWGSPPYQVMSIGGFYPGFNPAPALVAPMRRIALSPDFDGLPGLSLSFQAYLAVTSNTFQVGGRLDLTLNVGITAEGYVTLDALFQFKPFHFDVDIHGGLRVGVLGKTFAGVDVSGHISGPGPIVLRASISIDLWLTDFDWSDTFTLGTQGGESTEAIDLVPALAAELVPSNLRARGGDDPLVALKPAPAGNVALVSPIGILVFTQRSAPLNLQLQRFQSVKLRAPTTAVIEPTDPAITHGATEPDFFAPGTFLELSAAEAMNQPPFDRLDAGFELLFAGANATARDKTVDYQNYYRGRPRQWGVLHHFDAAVLGLLAGRRAAPDVSDRAALVTVRDEAWVTRSAGGAVAAMSSRTAAHVAVRNGRADLALAQADEPVSLAGVA